MICVILFLLFLVIFFKKASSGAPRAKNSRPPQQGASYIVN
jgi:hypothetical protein